MPLTLPLLLVVGLVHAQVQANTASDYTCTQNTSSVQFALSTSSHSAWSSVSSCALTQCAGSGTSNTCCLQPSTPCYQYHTTNNSVICAPAILCTLLEPCDNVTYACSSNNFVCVNDSCCLLQAVCLPLTVINFCPSVPARRRSTVLHKVQVESSAFCAGIGENATGSYYPFIQAAAHSNFAAGCGLLFRRTRLTLDEIDCLPENATIQSANITLFGYTNDSFVKYSLSGEQNMSNGILIKRVLAPWNVDSVTWFTQPNTTDTNAALIPSTSSTQTVANSELYNFTIDITQLVRDIHASGPGNNHGVMFQLEREVRYRAMAFVAFNDPDTSRHPQVRIET